MPRPHSTSPLRSTPQGPEVVELSVVLPCLNEQETLATVIRKAQSSITELGVVGEVIVADNGSTDGSQAIAVAEGAVVVDVPMRGYGAALRAGIESARGTYVVMGDADDSYALEDLGPFLAELRNGADLVMGNRFKGGIEPGAMPWLHKYLGNPVLSFLGRLFFKIPVGDFHCGLRAFRREAIRGLGLQTTGMEFASEMVVHAAMAKLRIVEVPTILRPDGRSRAPHLRTWRDGWRHLKFLLAFSPRWLYFYPSMLLLAIGTVLLLALLPGPLHIGSVSFDIQTMVAAATMVVVGAQGVGLALLARAFAARLRLLPGSGPLDRLLDRFAMEHGLGAGAVMILSGLAAFVMAVTHWSTVGFGNLDYGSVRWPIVGLVLITTGAQIVLVSFMLSLTQMESSEREFVSVKSAPALRPAEPTARAAHRRTTTTKPSGRVR